MFVSAAYQVCDHSLFTAMKYVAAFAIAVAAAAVLYIKFLAH